MTTRFNTYGGAAVLVAVFGASGAMACDPGKPGYELSGDEAAEVYDCLAEGLHEGYKAGAKQWIPADKVADYRGWTQASTFPAAPGFHDSRFLMTWVNETGADDYMRYAEDPVIPVGTWIAKESFTVTDEGEAQPGPLFLMEKVAEGTSPETDDWFYMAVAPSGTPMGVNVISACSDCHQGAFGHQGGLGYPVEEARVAK